MKNFLTKAMLASAGAVLCSQAAHAQTVYTPRDMMLTLRQTSPSSATDDLSLDIGPASLYYDYNTTPFTVPGLSLSDVDAAFGNFNNVQWSVAGTTRIGDGGSPSIPANTLFVTRARPDVNTQSTPFNRAATGTQQNAASKIASIGAGYNGKTASGNSANTVVQVASAGNSASTFLGASGNLAGQFGGGSIENTTPSSFTSGDSYLDLYELTPGSGSGTYLGYFDLTSGGALTFDPIPEPSTYALLGVGGLLMLASRRLFRRQQA